MRFRNMCYKNVMPYPVYLQNPYLNNQNNLVNNDNKDNILHTLDIHSI